MDFKAKEFSVGDLVCVLPEPDTPLTLDSFTNVGVVMGSALNGEALEVWFCGNTKDTNYGALKHLLHPSRLALWWPDHMFIPGATVTVRGEPTHAVWEVLQRFKASNLHPPKVSLQLFGGDKHMKVNINRLIPDASVSLVPNQPVYLTDDKSLLTVVGEVSFPQDSSPPSIPAPA